MDQKTFELLEKIGAGISTVGAVATLVVKGISMVPGFSEKKKQNEFDKLFDNRMLRDGK